MLYFRMLLIMGITLYSSRVVLNVLGVEDFGIYNVVGGVVAMFGFLNNSMAITTQRFINFEMGKGDFKRVNHFFSLSLILHILIAVVVFILAETVGLWFFSAKLNIPFERIESALWVYHLSVLSAMITIIQVPYNATIIAYEKMNIYAYIGIVEAVLKLLIVFVLYWFGVDKLKLYAVLVFFVTFLISVTYMMYSKMKIRECTFNWFWDKDMFKDLYTQSSWNLLGTSSNMLMQQGSKVIINMFFGVTLNAASSIASQVSSAVTNFVTNFLTAIRPQIVKMYAEGRMDVLYSLIYKGASFSFYLIFFLSLPILFQTEAILSLWLKQVPPFTVVFTRLILIDGLINTITVSLRTAIQASGRVKYYQISVSFLLLLTIPLSYILFRIGYPPEYVYIVTILISLLTLWVRVILLHRIISLPILDFIHEVIGRILLVTIPCVIIVASVNCISINHGILKLCLIFVVSSFTSVLFVYCFGIDQKMKKQIKMRLCQLVKKNSKY